MWKARSEDARASEPFSRRPVRPRPANVDRTGVVGPESPLILPIRGRMRILATLNPPEATQAILACLGLPVRAPPTLPARPDDDPEATAEAWGYEPGPDT